MKKKSICLMFVFLTNFGFSQTDIPTDFLPKEFHKNRREILRSKMPKNSVAVLFSNPIRNRANDVDYVFHQDPNFYYLTGLREPNSLLVLFSEKQTDELGNIYDEILYIQKRDRYAEMWNGKRLGIEGAKNKLGFLTVKKLNDFIVDKINFKKFDKVFVQEFKDDYRDLTGTDIFDLVKSFKINIGYDPNLLLLKSKINVDFLKSSLTSMREIKTIEEIALLTKAIRISSVGQIEVMKAMKPHMSEAEIQGIHEFVYKKYGVEYEGYPSIVGAGNNGCILHYIENNKTKVGNNLVLMDLGAEYRGYTADITRTIPANGKFTKEQKEIYDLVLEAQEVGISKYRIGTSMVQPDQVMRKIINQGLYKLGIIKSIDEKHKYFPHGSIHHIGLDVHDPGNYHDFEENMLVTIEPGIYIPKGSNCDQKYWGIAIRIEDDILITKNGPMNLSIGVPKSTNDIEKMMAKKSILDQFILPNLNE